ncbi:MAG: FAD-dependent oxidoreductase [Desulfatitalea sp.]|nr:FAD-dependent oxidoreductase [Desulfatitalea sp.]
MATDDMYDLVIVGGGPGGLSAAIYGMRAALRTVLVEKAVQGGQINLSDSVENYPGFTHIGGADLSMRFAEHARSYNLEEISEEAVAIEPGLEHHTVRLADGRALASHAVILATGGTPRKLKVSGEDALYGKGVSYCAVCDGFFFRGKKVIVVGGGDSACEEGLYLAKLAEKVYLVHRRDALRASMILQQRVAAECKMEVLWNSVVSEIKEAGGGVSGVRLRDTRNGHPNSQLVPAGVRRSVDGFVLTDDQCATAIPGIYAIGDLRERYARQIVLAAADGCMAALSAAHYVETRKAQAANSCELPAGL